MVKDIILTLCIPLSAYIGFRCSIKAYELGLKHNFELKNNIAPTENKNVIEKIVESAEETRLRKDQEQKMQQMINEYLGY